MASEEKKVVRHAINGDEYRDEIAAAIKLLSVQTQVKLAALVFDCEMHYDFDVDEHGWNDALVARYDRYRKIVERKDPLTLINMWREILTELIAVKPDVRSALKRVSDGVDSPAYAWELVRREFGCYSE